MRSKTQTGASQGARQRERFSQGKAVSLVNSVEERQSYYRNLHVRARIREFLGPARNGELSCEFLAASDENASPPFTRYSPRALNSLLDDGFEICRSLWDRDALIADFDIEYVNSDNPDEAFLSPERVFAIQQPVARTIEQLLREYGIPALHVLSGRGHHFFWRIEQSSSEFQKLSAFGRGPPSLWEAEAQHHSPNGHAVPPQLARAFAGLWFGDGISRASRETNRGAAHADPSRIDSG